LGFFDNIVVVHLVSVKTGYSVLVIARVRILQRPDWCVLIHKAEQHHCRNYVEKRHARVVVAGTGPPSRTRRPECAIEMNERRLERGHATHVACKDLEHAARDRQIQGCGHCQENLESEHHRPRRLLLFVPSLHLLRAFTRIQNLNTSPLRGTVNRHGCRAHVSITDHVGATRVHLTHDAARDEHEH
jgi:hypothetical protein